MESKQRTQEVYYNSTVNSPTCTKTVQKCTNQ